MLCQINIIKVSNCSLNEVIPISVIPISVLLKWVMAIWYSFIVAYLVTNGNTCMAVSQEQSCHRPDVPALLALCTS